MDRSATSRLVEHLRTLAGAAIEHVILAPRGPWDLETPEAVVSILPEVHAIPAAA